MSVSYRTISLPFEAIRAEYLSRTQWLRKGRPSCPFCTRYKLATWPKTYDRYIYILAEAARLRRASTAIYAHGYSHELCTVLYCCGVAENGSPYTFQNGGRSFSGFSPRATRLKRICARHPFKDTLRLGVQSAVEVSWQFGCVHSRNSRTTVFNSSLYI